MLHWTNEHAYHNLGLQMHVIMSYASYITAKHTGKINEINGGSLSKQMRDTSYSFRTIHDFFIPFISQFYWCSGLCRLLEAL